MDNEELKEPSPITIPETSKITNEIVELETMNSELVNGSENVEAVKIDSPIKAVEGKLSDFVGDLFASVDRDLSFNEALKAEILQRMPSLDDRLLLGLFSNNNVNLNDKISKTMAPLSHLMVAKQEAEIAQAARDQARAEKAANQITINTQNNASNPVANAQMKSLNEQASADVIQGFNTIFNMYNALKKQAKEESKTEE